MRAHVARVLLQGMTGVRMCRGFPKNRTMPAALWNASREYESSLASWLAHKLVPLATHVPEPFPQRTRFHACRSHPRHLRSDRGYVHPRVDLAQPLAGTVGAQCDGCHCRHRMRHRLVSRAAWTQLARHGDPGHRSRRADSCHGQGEVGQGRIGARAVPGLSKAGSNTVVAIARQQNRLEPGFSTRCR